MLSGKIINHRKECIFPYGKMTVKMNIFRNLVAYEYKKILKKKSTVIVLFLTIVLAALSVYGTVIGYYYDRKGEIISSKYQYLVEERDFARKISGSKIDKDLIMTASAAYSRSPQSPEDYMNEEEARKYYAIYEIVGGVLDTDSVEFSQLTDEQAASFYELRNQQIDDYFEKSDLSDKAKQYVRDADAKVQIPITYEYYGGYQRYLTIMYTTALLAASAIAILFAPLFSGEYISGADSLILSSKHGKGLVIGAKLVVMTTFSLALAVFLCVLSFIECIVMWGPDGANAAIQLLVINSNMPLTFGTMTILYTICIFGACLLTAAMTGILSSFIKTPFGTIVIMAVVLIAPLFINISEYRSVPYKLFLLLPSNMIAFWSTISSVPYDLFGVIIPPYVFMPVFAVLASAVLAAVSFFRFKSHQVA